jgi:menaquinone-specific isochorismate synthase
MNSLCVLLLRYLREIKTLKAEQWEKSSTIQSFTLEIKDFPASIFDFLEKTPDPDAASSYTSAKTYWKSRDTDFEVFALGKILSFAFDEWSSYKEQLRNFLKNSPSTLKLYGGLAFDTNAQPSVEWSEFGKGELVLPTLEIYREQGNTFLRINTLLGDFPKALHALEIYFNQEELPSSFGLVILEEPRHEPNKESWKNKIVEVLRRIKNKDFLKMVLARKSSVSPKNLTKPRQLLGSLDQRGVGTFLFWYEKINSVFFGATPELLLTIKKSAVKSEALAGTRKRGQNETEDRLLQAELLSGEKERSEHLLVLDHVKSILVKYCQEVSPGDLSLKKLSKVQHLVQPLSATLQPTFDQWDVLEALHPTAATGIFPPRQNLRVIAELEGFSRGWYAGALGWVSPNSAEWAVGLRSCLFHKDPPTGKKEICFYAGAGILEGSDPELEWEEINQKISGFLSQAEVS